MRILPADRKGFIHLYVLAGFDTAAAKNALLRVVAVEGVRMILFIRLGMIGNRLMLDAQQSFRVVNGAVSVVVVAHGAVENVIAENAIKRLPLCSAGLLRICQNLHSRGYAGRARSHELPVDLNHACVTRLDRTKLRVIADLRNLHTRPIDEIDQAFTAYRFLDYAIDCYAYHRSPPQDRALDPEPIAQRKIHGECRARHV